MALRPNEVAALLTLASVLKQSGKREQARSVLERASALQPELKQMYLDPLEREIQNLSKGMSGMKEWNGRV